MSELEDQRARRYTEAIERMWLASPEGGTYTAEDVARAVMRLADTEVEKAKWSALSEARDALKGKGKPLFHDGYCVSHARRDCEWCEADTACESSCTCTGVGLRIKLAALTGTIEHATDCPQAGSETIDH